jgi:hypothetical protein
MKQIMAILKVPTHPSSLDTQCFPFELKLPTVSLSLAIPPQKQKHQINVLNKMMICIILPPHHTTTPPHHHTTM